MTNDGAAGPGERDVPECWESLATDLFNLVLGNFEWVRAQGGRHSVCPLCHATCERDGGPGHQDDCPRLDYARRFDALRAALREPAGQPDHRYFDDKGEYLDGPHWGKDCPKGEVQVCFLGADPKLQFSPYSWKPEKHVFIEVSIDGEPWRIDIGDYEANVPGGKRRGIHVNGPFGLQSDKHSVNAVDLFKSEESEVALRDPLEAQDENKRVHVEPQKVMAYRPIATTIVQAKPHVRRENAEESSAIEPPEAQDGHRMVLSDQDGRWLFTDECGQRWRLTETGDESMPLLIEAVSKGRSSLPEGQK